MKVNRIMAHLAAVTIGAGFTLLAFAEGEKEEAVSWSQVPAAAQQTIKQYTPQMAIQRIEKDEEGGKSSYEFQILQGDKKSEITVTADGKLLSKEEVVALADTPAAARQTLETQASGGKMGTVEKVTEDGKTTFETKVEKDGKKIEITVTQGGKVAGTEDVTKEKE